ncbi:hypothetical protein KY345_00445 [Candidatus Woesearchaeota archaeon]|nr:hypothetical protein [Candidatus Woesearchaeota archaeon]
MKSLKNIISAGLLLSQLAYFNCGFRENPVLYAETEPQTQDSLSLDDTENISPRETDPKFHCLYYVFEDENNDVSDIMDLSDDNSPLNKVTNFYKREGNRYGLDINVSFEVTGPIKISKTDLVGDSRRTFNELAISEADSSISREHIIPILVSDDDIFFSCYASNVIINHRLFNNFEEILAHEIGHFFGASDHYQSFARYYPEGFAEPDKKPLYPENFTEVMTNSKTLENAVIGLYSALQMGWVKEKVSDAKPVIHMFLELPDSLNRKKCILKMLYYNPNYDLPHELGSFENRTYPGRHLIEEIMIDFEGDGVQDTVLRDEQIDNKIIEGENALRINEPHIIFEYPSYGNFKTIATAIGEEGLKGYDTADVEVKPPSASFLKTLQDTIKILKFEPHDTYIEYAVNVPYIKAAFNGNVRQTNQEGWMHFGPNFSTDTPGEQRVTFWHDYYKTYEEAPEHLRADTTFNAQW